MYSGFKVQNHEPASQEFLILKKMKWLNVVGGGQMALSECCSSHTLIASGLDFTM